MALTWEMRAWQSCVGVCEERENERVEGREGERERGREGEREREREK